MVFISPKEEDWYHCLPKQRGSKGTELLRDIQQVETNPAILLLHLILIAPLGKHTAMGHQGIWGMGQCMGWYGRSSWEEHSEMQLGQPLGLAKPWSPCEAEEWQNMERRTKNIFTGAVGLSSYVERLPCTEFQNFKEKWNSWSIFLYIVRMGKWSPKLLTEVRQ